MFPLPPPTRFPSRLRDHLHAGVLAACVAAVVDVATTIGNLAAQGGVRGVGAWALGAGHLLAWQVLVGASAGGLVAGLVQLAEPAPTRLRLRWGLHAPGDFFRPAPDLAADGIAVLSLSGALVAGLHLLASRTLDSFHDPSLARWAIAGSGLALALGLTMVGPVVRRLATWIVFPIRRATHPALLSVVAIETVGAVFGHVRETRPALLAGLDSRAVALLLVTPVAYGLVLACRAARPRETIAPWRRSLLPLLVAVAALAASAATYDLTSTHRRVVEDASLLGRYEVRVLHRLTDWDGDGYSARFGGGDCDDARSDVHPRAVDRPGDGLDADCFAGDGSPEFEDRAPIPPTARALVGAPPPNILLVTIDTLRPDHVGALGYRRRVTPRIDELASGATTFSDVTAAAPRTVRSVGAMMTGLYPGEIDYRVVHLWPELEASNTLLSERLRPRYQTSAVLGTDYFHRARGFEQGFDRIYISPTYKPFRGTVVERAMDELAALSSSRRPFFLWVHFFGPHEPYLSDGAVSTFGANPIDRYDTEILRADAEAGELFDGLRSLGLWDRTVVVVASDHGEAFGEHGTTGHSSTVYEEQVRAFLAIRVPGASRRLVRTPVALFDVYATLLDVAGVHDAPPTSARTLLPAVLGRNAPPASRPIFAEVFPDGTYALEAFAVRRGDDKLIYYPRTNRFELYDLASDPSESLDRSDVTRGVGREFRRLLLAWEIATHRPENATANVIAESLLARLPTEVVDRPRAVFGNEIVLEGYRMPPSARNGDVLPIDLYFRCLAPIRGDYWFHVAFRTEDGAILPPDFEGHHQPVQGRYPTSRWRPGDLIHDRVLVRITNGVPRGEQIHATLEIWPQPRQPMPYLRDGRLQTNFDLGSFIAR